MGPSEFLHENGFHGLGEGTLALRVPPSCPAARWGPPCPPARAASPGLWALLFPSAPLATRPQTRGPLGSGVHLFPLLCRLLSGPLRPSRLLHAPLLSAVGGGGLPLGTRQRPWPCAEPPSPGPRRRRLTSFRPPSSFPPQGPCTAAPPSRDAPAPHVPIAPPSPPARLPQLPFPGRPS